MHTEIAFFANGIARLSVRTHLVVNSKNLTQSQWWGDDWLVW